MFILFSPLVSSFAWHRRQLCGFGPRQFAFLHSFFWQAIYDWLYDEREDSSLYFFFFVCVRVCFTTKNKIDRQRKMDRYMFVFQFVFSSLFSWFSFHLFIFFVSLFCQLYLIKALILSTCASTQNVDEKTNHGLTAFAVLCCSCNLKRKRNAQKFSSFTYSMLNRKWSMKK